MTQTQDQITLKHVFSLYPIRKVLMQHMSATEVSMLAVALSDNLTESERNAFQDPIRDLQEYQDWIREKRNNGFQVRLIGKDVLALLDRILRPERYLRRYWRNEELTIWLAVVPGTLQSPRFRSSFEPLLGEDPKSLLVHGSQYATDDHGVSWFHGPKGNDQSIRIIQYLTNHSLVGEREVRLVPHMKSFRYVLDFHEYSTNIWPGLVTGVWDRGQCPKVEPLYSTACLDLENPFRIELYTSSNAQIRDGLREGDGLLQMKLETPYMEGYNVVKRTPQISIVL